jgi:hypothetical protein
MVVKVIVLYYIEFLLLTVLAVYEAPLLLYHMLLHKLFVDTSGKNKGPSNLEYMTY